MNIITMSMGIIAGAAMAVQAGVNAQLAKHWAKNTVLASATSFFIGALSLWVVCLILRIPVPVLNDGILWWHWIGGLLGAYYVTLVVYLSPRMGASMVVALILAGQILAAVVLDHFGLIGFPVRLVTPFRLIGIALLVIGVTTIRKS